MALKNFLKNVKKAISSMSTEFDDKLYITLAFGELYNYGTDLGIDYNEFESVVQDFTNRLNNSELTIDDLYDNIECRVGRLKYTDDGELKIIPSNIGLIYQIIINFETLRHKIMWGGTDYNFGINNVDKYLRRFFDLNIKFYYKIIDKEITKLCDDYMDSINNDNTLTESNKKSHNERLYNIGKYYRFYCSLNRVEYSIDYLVNTHGLHYCKEHFKSIEFLDSLNEGGFGSHNFDRGVEDFVVRASIPKANNIILHEDSRNKTPQYIIDNIKNKNVDIDGDEIQSYISNCVWIYDKLEASDKEYNFLMPNLCFVHDFNVIEGGFGKEQEAIYTNEILYRTFISKTERHSKHFNNLLYSGACRANIFNAINECEDSLLCYSRFISSHIFVGDLLSIVEDTKRNSNNDVLSMMYDLKGTKNPRVDENGIAFDISVPLESIVIEHNSKNIYADFYLGRCGNVFFRLRNFEHKNQ